MSLRVGVIGLGVGEQHAAGWAAHEGCEVAALCDIDGDRLEEVGARYPDAARVGDADELIAMDDLDAVSIASYDDAHAAQVAAALRAGKHVFVEKPLCMRLEELTGIKGLLAKRPELRLSSNLPLRRSPRFQALKALLEEGRLGELYAVEAGYLYGRLHKITEGWRGELPYYSVTLGGGVHMVDLVLWLTGARAVEATAAGNAIATRGSGFRFDDFVTATVRFEDGMLARIESNFGSVHPHYHELKLFGTRGTWLNGLERGALWLAGEGGAEPAAEPVEQPYPGVEKSDLIAPFADWVLTGSPPAVTPEEVFAAMELCLAIDEAHRSGATVTVGG